MAEDAPSSPERQTRNVTNNGGDIGGNSGGTAESLVGKASSKKSRLAAAKKVSKATTKAKKEKAIKLLESVEPQNVPVYIQDTIVNFYRNLNAEDDVANSAATTTQVTAITTKKPPKVFNDTYKYQDGIERNGPPVSNIEQMFEKFVVKLAASPGFEAFKKVFHNSLIRIGTLCSGTECPILAMEQLQNAFNRLEGLAFSHSHEFSAEIEPIKQAYIHRNWPGVTIFRDITDFADQESNGKLEAFTAFGAKAEVPRNIDLLVAGFCCVDFSKISHHNKTIAELGESGDTFQAILEYIKYAKPTLVILENVSTAPWHDAKVIKGQIRQQFLDEMGGDFTQWPGWLREKTLNREMPRGIDGWMDTFGYASHHVAVDTRDFLIPQTRNRGYMLCMPYTCFNNDKRKAAEELERWADLLRSTRIPATVAAETMLLEVKEDMRRAPEQIEELSQKKKETAWTKCQSDHAKYRRELELGFKRPLTKWNGTGYKSLPGWWTPMKGMTDRVLDFLEIQHLRSINRGFDDRYYSRLCDISQNVFRTQDVLSTGLMSCLTPMGMPWLTAKGRRITGRESLTLQGLPVNRMDLSYLSEGEMQQLTGNAMSSTVVGVAMMAALILFHDKLKFLEKRPLAQSATTIFPNEGDLKEKKVNPSVLITPISVQEALEYATWTVKLCTCEDRHDTTEKAFKECTTCKFTTCVEHSHNPPHCFQPFSVENRKFPGEFEKRLKDGLPLRLSFEESSIEEFRAMNQSCNAYSLENQDDICRALESELGLRTIDRSDIWEVIYESISAKLVLRISRDDIRWTLYAKPPADTAFNDRRRTKLEQFPIATMFPQGDDITKGQWKMWLPKKHSVRARIRSSGELIRSSRATRGLENARDTWVFNQWVLEVLEEDKAILPRDINGSFVLHQECAKPFDSLHVQTPTDASSKPLFLFLDHPLQTGNPVEHGYVLTEDARALEYGQHREVIARIPAHIKPPTFYNPEESDNWHLLRFDERKITKHLPGELDPTCEFSVDRYLGAAIDPPIDEPMGKPKPEYYVKETRISVDGVWTEFSSLELRLGNADNIVYRSLQLGNLIVNNSCKKQLAAFVCEATLPVDMANSFVREVWHIVGQENEVHFFQNIGHLLERGRVLQHDVEGQENWIDVTFDDFNKCDACGPSHPSMLWHYDKKWNKDGKKKSGVEKQRPYEDPEEAAIFEKRLRDRPVGLTAMFHIDNNNKLTFKIGINALSLVHRAVAQMVQDDDNDCSGNSNKGKIEAKVLLHTNDDTVPRAHLEPFKFRNNSPEDAPSLRPLEQPSYLAEKNLPLREDQLRTGGWGRDCEEDPEIFEEKELVENRMFAIKYRLWGMAIRGVSIRGGILASSVGYGKTATVLAICYSQTDADMAHMRRNDTEESPGCIYLKATLVIVPPVLIDQWEEEINKFSPPGVVIVKLTKMIDLDKLKVEKIKKADFILFNVKIFESSIYLKKLADLAGMVQHEANPSPRAEKAWHKLARANIASNINRLVSGEPLEDVEELIYDQIKKHEENAKNTLVKASSKRVKGENYISFEKRRAQAKEEEAKEAAAAAAAEATSKRKREQKQEQDESAKARPRFLHYEGSNRDTLSHLPLEAFNFARVIVDEFHYLRGNNFEHVKNLKRRATWLLSGTPPVNNFTDISRMARLLGVRLGDEDFKSMPNQEYLDRQKEMTQMEKFLMYQPAPSSHWKQARHGFAQEFLDHFLRKDEFDYTKEKYDTIYHLTHQRPMERLAYLELEQKLSGSLLEIGGHMKLSTMSDVDIQLAQGMKKTKEAFKSICKSGEQVLLWGATSFNPTFKVDDKTLTPLETGLSRQLTLFARQSDVARTVKDIKNIAMNAQWLATLQDAKNTPSADKFNDFISQIDTNSFGDSAATKWVKYALEDAEESALDYEWSQSYREFKDTTGPRSLLTLYPYPGYQARSNGSMRTLAEHYLREQASSLHNATTELVKLIRAYQFAQSVDQLQRQPEPLCPVCQMNAPRQKFTVFCQCGHMVCKVCEENVTNNNSAEVCPIDGCQVINVSYSKVSALQFLVQESPLTYPYGQKAQDLVNRVRGLLHESKDRKILIFYQDEDMRVKLEAILKSLGIGSDYLDESDKASEKLQKFKDPMCMKSILFLNISNSSAAGCNLTIADVVIFFSPYLSTGSAAQQLYDAAMKQAIGRAHRFGQKKIVQVYHFLTSKTFDVDLFEERNSSVLEQVEGSGEIYERKVEKGDTDFTGQFSSNIARIVLGRNERL